MAVEGGPIAQAAVELVADYGDFPEDVKAKLRKAAGDAGKVFDEEFKRRTKDTGRDTGDRVGKDTATGVGRGGEEAGKTWADAFKQAIAFRITSKAIGTILAPLKAIGAILGVSVIGAGATAATVPLLSLIGTLAETSGALLAIPSAVAVYGAAMLSMRVATLGMAEAFEAALKGDPEKFKEAIEELAPAGQRVAKEFAALRPELVQTRNVVQQAFFKPLVGELTAVAAVMMGPVRAGMRGVAGEAGTIAQGIAEVAKQRATVDLIRASFDTAEGSLDALQPGVVALATGFRDLAGVALPLFDQMSAGAGGLLVQFGEWLSHISQSGQALAWIQNALNILGQLGQVFLQVGGIITAVIRAASASGGSFLTTLTEMLTRVNAFLSSGTGQTALANTFAALREVAAALWPVVQVLLVQLGQFAPVAAQIAVALGPGLAAIIEALGQALVAMGPGLVAVSKGLSEGLIAAGPGLAQLGAAIGQLLAALAPLLPVLGQIAGIIASSLAQALILLMPVIRAVVDAFVAGLAPVLPDIAAAFAAVMNALRPLMPVLAVLLGFIARILASGLAIGIQLIAGAIRIMADVLGFVIGLVAQFVTWITSIDFGAMAAAIGNFFLGLGKTLLGFFAALPGMILSALAGLGLLLLNIFVGAIRLVLGALGALIGLIILFFVELPPRIGRFLASLPGVLLRVFTNAVNWARNAVVTGFNAVVSWIAQLPGRIGSFLSRLPGLIGGFFRNAFNAALNAVRTVGGAVVSWVASIPGKLAAFGGRMLSAGKSLITAFWNGLKSVGGFIGDVAGAIVRGIKNAINWVIGAINSGISAVWPESLFGAPPQIPKLAKGGIITHRMIAEVGEEGTEVVIPMTKPRRAVELAEKSGLVKLLADRNVLAAAPAPAPVQAGPGKVVHVDAPITVHSHAANPEFAARRAYDHIAALAQA